MTHENSTTVEQVYWKQHRDSQTIKKETVPEDDTVKTKKEAIEEVNISCDCVKHEHNDKAICDFDLTRLDRPEKHAISIKNELCCENAPKDVLVLDLEACNYKVPNSQATTTFKQQWNNTETELNSHVQPFCKEFKCDSCPRQYTRAEALKAHKKLHSGEKLFSCELCDKKFIYSSKLQRHRRTHTGEKPHACAVCAKTFARFAHLKDHELTHTGEKPHFCTVCAKAFTTSSDLRRHQLTHTGEKPHVCTLCGKGFSQSGTLRHHKRIHTGVKPYVCSECGKAFTTFSQLINHKYVHTEEKPHICAVCGKGFTRPVDFKHKCKH